jgi:crotonobetainyl-CoA:carnitine CoA-transferase CaiB-like acyl-CoA transferase
MDEGDITGRAPRGAHPSATPSQMFKAADGWMFVMAQIPKFWPILCERIGQSKLIADSRFDTLANRLANRAALSELLDAVFGERPVAYWLELLQGHMPISPVYELDQALDNPWLETIGMRDTISHPDNPEMEVLSSPIKLNGERLPNKAGPLLGADSDSILAEIGYDEDAIIKLRAGGII